MPRDSAIFNVCGPVPNGYPLDYLLPRSWLMVFGVPEFAFTSEMVTQFLAQQTTCLHK